MTPLIALDGIAPDLWMKDEGRGPTGSWLDRADNRKVRVEDMLRPPPLSSETLLAIRAEIEAQIGGDVLVISEAGVAVSMRAAMEAGLEVLRLHGFLPSIRGAMALAARPPTGRVVVINPESGLRDLHIYARRFPQIAQSETDKLGGLITPR